MFRNLRSGGIDLPARSVAPSVLTRPNISIKGKWHYLYRAVDKQGRSVDFMLRSDRGIAAAQAFFRKALTSHPDRAPRKVTLDGHVPSHRALRLLRREHPAWRRVRVRSSKYLNNIIEQDHRAIKVPELVPELLANQDDRCRIRMVRRA